MRRPTKVLLKSAILRAFGRASQAAVENPKRVSRGVDSVALDGKALGEGLTRVALADDGAVHKVRVVLG